MWQVVEGQLGPATVPGQSSQAAEPGLASEPPSHWGLFNDCMRGRHTPRRSRDSAVERGGETGGELKRVPQLYVYPEP